MECVDCRLRVPECSANAIYDEDDLPAMLPSWVDLNLEISNRWSMICEPRTRLRSRSVWRMRLKKGTTFRAPGPDQLMGLINISGISICIHLCQVSGQWVFQNLVAYMIRSLSCRDSNLTLVAVAVSHRPDNAIVQCTVSPDRERDANHDRNPFELDKP